MITAHRPRDRGLSLVEVLVAIEIVVSIALVAMTTMGTSSRSLARMEDLSRFQGLGIQMADAVAAADYEFVRSTASRPGAPSADWETWEVAVLPAAPAGLTVRSWVEEANDADALLLTVEVRWAPAAAAGRAIRYETRVRRLMTRPEASLAVSVPLEVAP